MENNLVPHQNTKNHYDPVILFLSIHPKEEKYPRFMHIYAHGRSLHNNHEIEVPMLGLDLEWTGLASKNALRAAISLMPSHKSTQTNAAEVDKVTGRLNGQFQTCTICGAICRMGDSKALILRLAKADLELPERTFYQKNSENICHKIVRNQREREWMDGSSSTCQPVGEWVKWICIKWNITKLFHVYWLYKIRSFIMTLPCIHKMYF